MTDPIARPLADLTAELLETLQPLLKHTHSELPRGAIARAHALALALHQHLAPKAEPAIDRATFDALLEIAGEETAPRLLDQVLLDLEDVRNSLRQAIPAADWVAMRRQSHILMAIAGSFGATPLHHDAERLNRIAHACDPEGLAEIQQRLLERLDDLLAFLEAETQRRGYSVALQRSAR